MTYKEASLKAGSIKAADTSLHVLTPRHEARVSVSTFEAPSADFSPLKGLPYKGGSLSLVYSTAKGKAASKQEERLKEETAHHKSIIMKDTFFTQSVLTLTTGVFITGFALKLHAPTLIIGLLVAIPALAQLLQLPSVALVARSASLKRLLIQSTLLSRLSLLSLVGIPFLPKEFAIAALVIFYSLYAGLAAISTCSWNTWVRDTIHPKELGGFFSKKLALSSLITLLLTFFGGLFIDCGADFCQKIQTPVYSLLFLFAGLLGVYGVFPLRHIKETPHKHPEVPSPELAKMLLDAGIEPESTVTTPELNKGLGFGNLLTPFKEKNYRSLIRFLTIYDFSINLTLPFLTVYMLNSLHYSMGLVSAVTIISQVANYLCLPTWGRIADRFSNKSVLMLCGPIQLFCILAWACCVLPGNTTVTLPLVIGIQLLLGVGTAGVSLANGNIAMKLSPAHKGAPHMACTNMMASLASGAAPLLSGWVSQTFEKPTFGFPFLQDSYWYILFGLACFFGLVALFQLGKVDEEGSVSNRELIQCLFVEPTRRRMRQTIS